MADTIRYIDTDVVGGLGDGSSWANAYSSMAAWSAAEGTTIGAADRHLAYFRGTTLDTATAILNFSADGWGGTGELHLIGDGPDNPTQIDATKYRWQAHLTNYPFRADLPTLTFKMFNLQRIFAGNFIAGGIRCTDGSTFGTIEQHHCVDDWRGNTYTLQRSLVIEGVTATTGSLTRSDCLILGVLSSDLRGNYTSGGTYTTSRCTFAGCDGTFTDIQATSTINYTDCAIVGTYTLSAGQTPTLTNCATEAGTGTNPITVSNWALEFTDSASGDYSLLGTSQLIGAGSTTNNIGVDQTTAGAGGPSITSMTDPVTTNTSATIVCTGAEATQGTGGVTQGGVAVTETAWSDTSVTFDSVDIETSSLKYGNQTFVLTANGGGSDSIVAAVQPATNRAYVDIGTPATAGDRITATPVDLSTNDQVAYDTRLFASDGVTPTAYTVSIADTGIFTLGGGSIPDGTYYIKDIRVYDNSDNTWGALADQTVTISGGAVVSVPADSRTNVFQIANYLRSLGTYNSSQCNELVVEWLISEGITRAQLNQMLYSYLGGLGYTGTFNDRLKAWSNDP